MSMKPPGMGKESHLSRLSGEKIRQNRLGKSLAGILGGKNVGTPKRLFHFSATTLTPSVPDSHSSLLPIFSYRSRLLRTAVEPNPTRVEAFCLLSLVFLRTHKPYPHPGRTNFSVLLIQAGKSPSNLAVPSCGSNQFQHQE